MGRLTLDERVRMGAVDPADAIAEAIRAMIQAEIKGGSTSHLAVEEELADVIRAALAQSVEDNERWL